MDLLDYSNPFYLQHGDHPGVILVSQPLNGDNYLTWNRSMSMALISKNKLCFVNGALPPPPLSDPMHNAWIRCNTVVLSWLLNAMSKEIAALVIYIDSAEEMWNDLKESSYFTRLKGCWEEMVHFRPMPPCTCGAIKKIVDFQQEDYVLQFLMGLNETYEHLQSQILLSDLFPPINKKDRPYCTHCGLSGHTIDKCYKIHGYPPGYKPKSRNPTANQATTSQYDLSNWRTIGVAKHSQGLYHLLQVPGTSSVSCKSVSIDSFSSFNLATDSYTL
ncbi:hypothetical protein I3843_15G119400 [Carya illinoinensis]|nr:hypothetical protein I3843_15G119400 [Carya illinoinensis]